MSNAFTAYLIFLGPLAVILAITLVAVIERWRAGPTAGPGFFARNGTPVALFLILAVGIWMLAMIVLPSLYMIDYSFHPKLPPSQRGGPKDIYTLANYRYFLFGSPDDTSHWNATHL